MILRWGGIDFAISAKSRVSKNMWWIRRGDRRCRWSRRYDERRLRCGRRWGIVYLVGWRRETWLVRWWFEGRRQLIVVSNVLVRDRLGFWILVRTQFTFKRFIYNVVKFDSKLLNKGKIWFDNWLIFDLMCDDDGREDDDGGGRDENDVCRQYDH